MPAEPLPIGRALLLVLAVAAVGMVAYLAFWSLSRPHELPEVIVTPATAEGAGEAAAHCARYHLVPTRPEPMDAGRVIYGCVRG